MSSTAAKFKGFTGAVVSITLEYEGSSIGRSVRVALKPGGVTKNPNTINEAIRREVMRQVHVMLDAKGVVP